MQLDLDGKVALVTGSSRGIGRAIAATLQREGCRVVLNGRDADALAATVRELPGSAAARGDVARPEDARRVIAEALGAFGALDIVVCNVGTGRSVPPGEETYDEWQRVFAV